MPLKPNEQEKAVSQRNQLGHWTKWFSVVALVLALSACEVNEESLSTTQGGGPPGTGGDPPLPPPPPVVGFKYCYRAPNGPNDQMAVENIATIFETNNRSMQRVFAETAVYCMGN